MTLANCGWMTDDEARTLAEKLMVLEKSAPKIVDVKKYYGPSVTDFRAIKERMKELE